MSPNSCLNTLKLDKHTESKDLCQTGHLHHMMDTNIMVW